MTMLETAKIERLEDVSPTQRPCALHHWTITYLRRPVEHEVYTCLHCGATFVRPVSYNARKEKRLAVPEVLPEWPTWDDIISQP